jgi:hypothetical protein
LKEVVMEGGIAAGKSMRQVFEFGGIVCQQFLFPVCMGGSLPVELESGFGEYGRFR